MNPLEVGLLRRLAPMAMVALTGLSSCTAANQAGGSLPSTPTTRVETSVPAGEVDPTTVTTEVAPVTVVTTVAAEPVVLPEVTVPFGESVETDDWVLAVTLPYGPEASGLGVVGSLGPELPAPAPDGTWWIPDSHRNRVVRFDEDGRLLDSIDTGIEFALYGLAVLADGSMVAATQRSAIAYIKDGEVEYHPGPDLASLRAVGTRVFAQSMWGPATFSIEPTESGLEVVTVEHFISRAGTPFTARMKSGGTVEIRWVDEDKWLVLNVHLEPTDGGEAFAVLEFDTDAKGNLHLLLTGFSIIGSSDTPGKRSVYLEVAPDGSIVVLSTPNPFGEYDPGSLGHLNVAEGTDRVFISRATAEGVEIYELVDSTTGE